MYSVEKNSYSITRNITLTALMIALIFICANVIKLPTFGGFIHLGDCMVLLSVIVLERKKGALASAVGMSLVDIFSGYLIWAPFTFIIKGLMAYIVGTILYKAKHFSIKNVLFSFVAGSVFMVIAYFLSGAIISRFFTGDINSILGALIYASKDIIGNIIQVSVGIALALPLSKVLLTSKNKIFKS